MRIMTFEELSSIAALAPKPPAPTPRVSTTRVKTGKAALDRATNYLSKMEPAVSGQAGHDATYRAACKLVVGFDLSPEEAYPLLLEWNERCNPPWDEEDLWRKLQEADRTSTQPRGHLARARREVLTDQERGGGGGGATVTNYTLEERQDGETMRPVAVGLSAAQIMSDLYVLTDGWPRRVGDRLFIVRANEARDPVMLENANALFGWLAGRVVTGSQIDWGKGPTCISRTEFFEFLRQEAHHYRHLERFPHWPPIANHCYLHSCLPEPTGTALAWLLNRFSPATPTDEDLILAFFLTLVWGGPGGARPAFLVTADEESEGGGRGFGKSTLLETGFELIGGSVSLGSNADFEGVKSRLLSRDGMKKRCLLLDNLKTLRYSCAEMEAMVTAREISGRMLYHGEGSRPNNIIIGITVNGANLSKDMAQRCVIIKVKRPPYQSNWQAETRDYIEAHRPQILADLIEQLKRPEKKLARYSRWSEWEGQVLSKVGDPDDCSRVIRERQEECDADEQATAEAIEAIRNWLFEKGRNPDTQAIAIKSKDLAEVLSEASGERLSTQKLTGWIKQRSISQLRFFRHREKGRVWIWREPDTPVETTVVDVHGFSFLSDDELDV